MHPMRQVRASMPAAYFHPQRAGKMRKRTLLKTKKGEDKNEIKIIIKWN